MITRIYARNYKNLELEENPPLSTLNIFVGANGSGKSNLIQILRFFQNAMTGSPEERRGIPAFEIATQALGSGRILNYEMPYPSRVDLALDFTVEPDYEHGLLLGLRVQDENTVTVAEESLIRSRKNHPVGETPSIYYQVHNKNVGRGVVSVFESDGWDKSRFQPVEDIPNNQLAFQSLQSSLEKTDAGFRNTPYYEMRRIISEYVQGWSFYSASTMDLQKVRSATPELGASDKILAESGENLALVLYNLAREIVFEERLTDAMKELFPKTRRIRVTTVGRRTLTLEWFLGNSARPFFLDEMSDGTVRMLCWAAVLLSPKPPSLVVLDEPEAGIHPAWLRVLAGWIREASRKTQVIVSTHSSDLLDYFTEDLESIHVFQESQEYPGRTEIKPLHPLLLADKLDEGWKLGDLYRVGDPGVGGWPW